MRQVLLLEEDLEAGEVLARVLRHRGFVVTEANDQSQALALADTCGIDLVIAGVTSYDRLEFLADLREKKPEVPVIFLNGAHGPESILLGIRYGAFTVARNLNFYLNMRTVRMNELDRIIRIALGGRRHDSCHLDFCKRPAAA